jgi:hypothetical protein
MEFFCSCSATGHSFGVPARTGASCTDQVLAYRHGPVPPAGFGGPSRIAVSSLGKTWPKTLLFPDWPWLWS